MTAPMTQVPVPTAIEGRDFIRNGHIFKTTIADEASWIIISETIWGECLVHSVSDDYPYINEKQDI